MRNLDDLYRQVIMDHYKSPHNKGLKQDENYKLIHLNNPSCGDDITIQVSVEDGIIKDVRQDGHGCSICCSSASVMTDTLVGKTIEEAKELIENFLKMVMGTDFDNNADLGEALVYQGVQKFPARVKCASLSWKAALKAISEE